MGGDRVRVMGIDPGTAIMGWAIADRGAGGRVQAVAYGAVQTAAGVPVERRLEQIYRQLSDLLAHYQPHQAVVEQLFFGRNVTTMLAVGQARGVALLACAQAGVPVMELALTSDKAAIW
jgi:crossover junction endodeoxyribonuclease RuvC